MSIDIADGLPQIFSSGETVKYRAAFTDFPASAGWTYSLYLNGTLAVLTKDGVADGDGFLVTIDPTRIRTRRRSRDSARSRRDGISITSSGDLRRERSVSVFVSATVAHFTRS